MDSAIQNKDALSQERQRNALAKAILSRFCPCEARDDMEIHMKRQGDISRLASRLQNYIHQQDAFKEELIRTYGPKETAALILDYARTKGTIEGDICVGDLHNFTAFWRIARPFIDNQGPNPSLSEEHIPKLKSMTPGSVVFCLSLQHRLMITKTDSGGVCTVRKGRDHRVLSWPHQTLLRESQMSSMKILLSLDCTMNNYGSQQSSCKTKTNGKTPLSILS